MIGDGYNLIAILGKPVVSSWSGLKINPSDSYRLATTDTF